MQFIVNYGRDNDTVAAVAGMILGAKLGYSGLPESMRNTVGAEGTPKIEFNFVGSPASRTERLTVNLHNLSELGALRLLLRIDLALRIVAISSNVLHLRG
jgi:hypothetical protein